MNFKIRHVTRYAYSEPISLDPHTLRLKPREDDHHKVHSFNLTITPTPARINEMLSLCGSCFHQVFFTGLTNSLTIESESIVETFRDNPFDFVLFPFELKHLPVQYTKQDQDILSPCLFQAHLSETIQLYTKKLLEESNNETIPFLTLLCESLFKLIGQEYRKSGYPYTPDETFSRKKGSCRDIAVLYKAICRHVGVASRFVSGYHFGDETDPSNKELHAWVEVYLPGGGWIGFDPSLGLAVSTDHVAICSSAYYEKCLPLEGLYTGSATSTLTTDISIHELSQLRSGLPFMGK